MGESSSRVFLQIRVPNTERRCTSLDTLRRAGWRTSRATDRSSWSHPTSPSARTIAGISASLCRADEPAEVRIGPELGGHAGRAWSAQSKLIGVLRNRGIFADNPTVAQPWFEEGSVRSSEPNPLITRIGVSGRLGETFLVLRADRRRSRASPIARGVWTRDNRDAPPPVNPCKQTR